MRPALRHTLVGAALLVAGTPLPKSTLAVRSGGGWRVWWSAESAPASWSARDTLRLGRIDWRKAAPGVEWSEIVLAGRGEAWRTRVIAARVDPRVVRLRLDTAYAEHAPAWTVDAVAANAIFAINAGQFLQSMPWGRVVLGGDEWLAAGRGPLSSFVMIDTAGRVRLAHGGTEGGDALWAFQSYPTLLRNGAVPEEIQGRRPGLDLEHRDARAAVGVAPDGQLIVALTRFDALGSTLGFIPFGLTTPEMTAVMGALGARDAVMLDGGISGQMLVGAAGPSRHAWRGVRAVPLALVGTPR